MEVPSASGIGPQGWREGKRKGRRKEALSPQLSFPPSLVLGNGMIDTAAGWSGGSTKWLCREESTLVILYTKKTHSLFLSPQGLVSPFYFKDRAFPSQS